MKKNVSILVIVFAALLVALPARGQEKLLNIGVKGGITLSSIDFGESSVFKGVEQNYTGFFVGPAVEVNVPLIGLGFDGAVMFSKRGDNEFKQQGIEIPLNLKYTIGLTNSLGLFVTAGPDFFYTFNDGDSYTLNSILGKVENEKSQVSLNLGFGLRFSNHLRLGANYLIPMGDSFSFKRATDVLGDEISDESEMKAKYRNWQIALTYYF